MSAHLNWFWIGVLLHSLFHTTVHANVSLCALQQSHAEAEQGHKVESTVVRHNVYDIR